MLLGDLGVRRLDRIEKLLETVLIPDEVVESMAVQRRVFAWLHRRRAVAATNNRLIGMTRGLFGGFHPVTIRWQDVRTADVKIGPFGAKITVVALDHPDLATTQQQFTITFSGLDKDEARNVYRICQAQEQAWREKRRIRELEELRAKSGGFQASPSEFIASSTSTRAIAAEAADSDPVASLTRVKQMLAQSLINDSEYEAVKAQILSRM